MRAKFEWSPAGNWKAPARSTRPARDVSIIAVTGVPMLPPTCTGVPELLQDVADQAGRGGLAVRSGDADHRALQERRGQFHFADHSHAARARRFERRQIGRHVGRKHDQRPSLRLGKQVQSVCSPESRHVERLQIGGAHRRRRARAETPPRPRPDFSIPTTRAFVPSIVHLSFNVVSANSASTRPAIQKRAMIFDSVQPSASK